MDKSKINFNNYITVVGIISVYSFSMLHEDYKVRKLKRFTCSDLSSHYKQAFPERYKNKIGNDVFLHIATYLEEPDAIKNSPLYPTIFKIYNFFQNDFHRIIKKTVYTITKGVIGLLTAIITSFRIITPFIIFDFIIIFFFIKLLSKIRGTNRNNNEIFLITLSLFNKPIKNIFRKAIFVNSIFGFLCGALSRNCREAMFL